MTFPGVLVDNFRFSDTSWPLMSSSVETGADLSVGYGIVDGDRDDHPTMAVTNSASLSLVVVIPTLRYANIC